MKQLPNKKLHFIWFPEAEDMPQSGKDNVKLWTDLNPTWTVLVWGMRDFTRFVNGSKYAPTWARLVGTLGNAEGEDRKPVLGKMSDFARLVLCHEYPSDLNAYADDDMSPLRPMEEWAEEPLREHSRHAKPKKFIHPLSRKRIDWDHVTTLFSGENVNNRGSQMSICNNFIISKPGQQFLEYLIHFCTQRIDEIVLRAFGPWAVTDAYWAMDASSRANGVIVIPWHYFNWLPKEMSPMTPPTWCVATHDQQLRWTTKNSYWLAGGNNMKLH